MAKDGLEAVVAYLSCPECKRVRRGTVYPELRPPTEHWLKCPVCGHVYPQSEAREIPTQGEDGRPRWVLPRRVDR